MVSRIKKAILAMAAYMGLIGCYSGIPAKGNYPTLTPELKQNLEERTLDLTGKVCIVGNSEDDANSKRGCQPVAFDGTPKEFLNYFVDFTQEDYAAKGIAMPGLDGVEVLLMPLEDIHDKCGDGAEACNRRRNYLLIPDCFNLYSFFNSFTHEFGHSLFNGNLEYPSVANSMYSAIKSYEFSRPIGSILVESAFDFVHDDLKTANAYDAKYLKAPLFSLLSLIDFNGDIEQAEDLIMHSSVLELEAKFGKLLPTLSGAQLPDRHFDAWEKLLALPGLKDQLTGGSAYLTQVEAEELIEYLRIINSKWYQVNMLSPGSNQERLPEIVHLQRSLIEEYLENESFNNPYFHAKVVKTLTMHLEDDMYIEMEKNGAYTRKSYDIAKNIVDINGHYPCRQGNRFECPDFVRDYDKLHLDAYLTMARFIEWRSPTYSQKIEMVNYVKDFIGRFYPGTDFDKGDFEAIRVPRSTMPNNYLPILSYTAGRIAYIDMNDANLAIKFYEAGLMPECVPNELEPKDSECSSAKASITYEIKKIQDKTN